ncbi:long-chain-fatty-acid--CoA ligase [Candidatus Marinamargulisbacteria bacterium SCGC AG-333-B06]|nr:long-chain-fatty-acid--CoA ligase [Candidatus Marinamargulisbacteria bacterium SCGC AG-333-B06]
MDKIWLKSYPAGIPESINIDDFNSIIDLFEQSCAKFADKPAYNSMGVRLTYQELDRLSKNFASYLQNELNLTKGDRLAIMMPNVLQYPITLFGAMRAGVTIVNVNPLYTPRELEHQLNDSGAKAIVILENFAHVLDQCITKTPIEHVITTEIGDCFGFLKRNLVNFVVRKVKKMVPPHSLSNALRFCNVIHDNSFNQFHPIPLTHQDIAFLQYTGGTTGVSKGAILTHANMLSNMQQAYAWVDLKEGCETVVTALPLYHIFSLTANCLVFMRVGGCNLLITNPRDIPLFIKTLKSTPFTAITGVNTLFNALMNHPDFSSIDFSNLTLSLGGGMAVQEAVANRWKELTGCTLAEAYGLTETSPAVCVNPLNIKEFNGAIGLPLPSTEVSIRRHDNTECELNEEGELCVKGPQVMQGYWNKEDETKHVFTSDGWLKTGDIATMDEGGYCRIVSREKDMILVSGFNVYPNEIEDVVVSLAGVSECAAIGVPDEKSGERVKLFIVKSDESLSEDVIKNHCKANLTDYKQPKYIEFRDELPKTNVGKILHRALRESPESFSEKMKDTLENKLNNTNQVAS